MSTRDDPFDYFPVTGAVHYSDEFGAPRVGHRHAGNDIFAPSGTPIVAPFAGVLMPTASPLCGVGFTVTGKLGHVLGCHLSRLSRPPGPVKAGSQIGYVDNTGNAAHTASHLHFEWHPFPTPKNPWTSPYGYDLISGAIDPFPFLQLAEGRVARPVSSTKRKSATVADCGPCVQLLKSLGSGVFSDPRFKKGGECWDCIQHSTIDNITGAFSDIGSFLGQLPAYFTIAGGGILILIALWLAAKEMGAPVGSPARAATVALPAPARAVARRRTARRAEASAERGRATQARQAGNVAYARQRGKQRAQFEGESSSDFEPGPPVSRARIARRGAARRRMETATARGHP